MGHFKSKQEEQEYNRLYYIHNKLRLKEKNQGRRDPLIIKAAAYVDKAKSVPCMDCKNTYPVACMDLHHRDPNNKRYNVSYMVGQGRPLFEIIEEVEKCDVICANCHRLRHSVGSTLAALNRLENGSSE